MVYTLGSNPVPGAKIDFLFFCVIIIVMKYSEGLLPHDVAEDVAYAQKPFIDIAHAVVLLAEQASDTVLLAQSADQAQATSGYTQVPPKTEVNLPQPLYTSTQAANALGVSRPFLIKRLLNEGIIPFHKVGRDRRISHSDLQSYLKDREETKRQE